jgi:hypothetical protein
MTLEARISERRGKSKRDLTLEARISERRGKSKRDLTLEAPGSGCIDPCLLDFGTTRRGMVSFKPLPLYPPAKKPPVPIG